MLKRTRTASAAAALVGGALLLAGCGGQAATNSAAAPENLGADTARSDTDPSSGTHDDISASNCSAEDFEITMQAQPDGGVFLLGMKNISDKACQLGGWVNLTPTNMAGQPMATPTENVNMPGPDQNLTLDPGKTAFSGVKVELSDQSDPDAEVASGFTATPSDMNGTVNVQVTDTNGGTGTMELPIKNLEVGTLQASPQGVVAF